MLETFKGAAKTARWVWTADKSLTIACAFPFEVGREYLVYGWEGRVALNTSFCTRTGPIEESAFDLEYLRHGTLPSPDTLRRGVVDCPCDLERVLAATGLTPSWPPGASARLLDAGMPLLEYGPIAPGSVERSLQGVDRDGGAFELRVVPAFRLCARRVFRHRCAQLQVEGHDLVCLGPGRDELLCDERRGRTGRWLPAEPESHASCEWLRGDTGTCRLSELTASGPEPTAGDGGTVLWCYPDERGDRETRFDCRLHRASEPPDGGPDDR